jgi:hypothetical protein
MDLQKSL